MDDEQKTLARLWSKFRNDYPEIGPDFDAIVEQQAKTVLAEVVGRGEDALAHVEEFGDKFVAAVGERTLDWMQTHGVRGIQPRLTGILADVVKFQEKFRHGGGE